MTGYWLDGKKSVAAKEPMISISKLRKALHVFKYVEFVAVIAVLVTYSLATHQRNFIWKSPLILWGDCAEKSPHKPRPRNNLGNAYYKAGLIHKAIFEYRRAISLAPGYAKAYNNLGATYYEIGLVDKAIDEYKKSIKLNPEDGESHYNYATALHKKGLVDEAIVEYNTSLKLKPENPDAHYNLGIAYLNKGLFDQGLVEFRAVLRLQPDDTNARYYLTRTKSRGSPQSASGP